MNDQEAPSQTQDSLQNPLLHDDPDDVVPERFTSEVESSPLQRPTTAQEIDYSKFHLFSYKAKAKELFLQALFEVRKRELAKQLFDFVFNGSWSRIIVSAQNTVTVWSHYWDIYAHPLRLHHPQNLYYFERALPRIGKTKLCKCDKQISRQSKSA